MNNILKNYFPMIKTKQEIQQYINSRPDLSRIFQNWETNQREEFLDFCSGAHGVKMMYDCFAKELLNPETVPERLNDLLSLLLGMEVRLTQILPNDNSRLGDESSLLIMDIIVKLEDGSHVNVEIQKIGYHFPGQRSACYSADLLLRQYKLVRSQKTKDTFTYRDIKDVYTIVFFEKSTPDFHAFPDRYIHTFSQKSDSGLELDLLQKYIFVPLDIFLKNHHNKTVDNRLDAWLMFLSSDDPEDIISLIKNYPDFRPMYEQVYEICRNIERVMGMFSEELRILDRNTVRYMMDEMQTEIDQKKAEIERKNSEIQKMDSDIQKLDSEIQKKNFEIENQKSEIENQKSEIENQKSEIENQKSIIAQLQNELRQSREQAQQQKLQDQ